MEYDLQEEQRSSKAESYRQKHRHAATDLWQTQVRATQSRSQLHKGGMESLAQKHAKSIPATSGPRSPTCLYSSVISLLPPPCRLLLLCMWRAEWSASSTSSMSCSRGCATGSGMH